jgi:hypothetical protein
MSGLKENEIKVALSIIKEQHPLQGISFIQAFPTVDFMFDRMSTWFKKRSHDP